MLRLVCDGSLLVCDGSLLVRCSFGYGVWFVFLRWFVAGLLLDALVYRNIYVCTSCASLTPWILFTFN